MSEIADFIAGLDNATIESIEFEAIGQVGRMDEYATTLHIEFVDGSSLNLADRGQACCEHRYMHTDDDIQAFVGSDLINLEIRAGGYSAEKDWGDVHEVQFLLVTTSLGVITLETHNIHNGYYGGFSVQAQFYSAHFLSPLVGDPMRATARFYLD